MANEAQLSILKQGVEAWNQWREAYPDEVIDLSGAKLNRAKLEKVNLSKVNLKEADLTGADLREADLHGADLGGTNLHRADLRLSKLQGAKLCWTDLSYAYLTVANLHNANLHKANLYNAHLDRAYLCNTNLYEAVLQEARLIHANLSQATLTGTCLYGTARDDWQIDRIICEYVFWDAGSKERTPKDRDFRPGEFEELYKQLPTFEYVFEHGFTPLDAVVMDRIVQAINEQHPEFELKLDSFQSRGQPHAKFTVLHKEHVEAAKQQVTINYESRITSLEGKVEQLTQMFALVGSGQVALQPTPGGMNLRQLLPADLTQAIVAFLITLPNIQDHQAQQAFLVSAGLDAALLAQLHVNQPPKPFMELLVASCVSYGQLADGRHALIALLEAAQQMVGADRRAECEALMQHIQAEYQ